MPNIRIATANQIRTLNNTAVRRGLNRALSDDALSALDDEGLSVVSIVLHHDHAGGVQIDPHYRCEVLLKVKHSDAPRRAMLDIFPDDFSALSPVPAGAE